jgi:hypothetical protein
MDQAGWGVWSSRELKRDPTRAPSICELKSSSWCLWIRRNALVHVHGRRASLGLCWARAREKSWQFKLHQDSPPTTATHGRFCSDTRSLLIISYLSISNMRWFNNVSFWVLLLFSKVSLTNFKLQMRAWVQKTRAFALSLLHASDLTLRLCTTPRGRKLQLSCKSPPTVCPQRFLVTLLHTHMLPCCLQTTGGV